MQSVLEGDRVSLNLRGLPLLSFIFRMPGDSLCKSFGNEIAFIQTKSLGDIPDADRKAVQHGLPVSSAVASTIQE
ncbi:hypothetical protein [Phormidesmis priestleyi]